jgi:hypothetical protein
MVATLADNGLSFPFQLRCLEDVHRQACLELVLACFFFFTEVWKKFGFLVAKSTNPE